MSTSQPVNQSTSQPVNQSTTFIAKDNELTNFFKRSIIIFYLLFFILSYTKAQINFSAFDIVSTTLDSEYYIPGCTRVVIKLHICNPQAETDPTVNFYIGPTSGDAFYYSDPLFPSQGNFTTYGFNNSHVIGSISSFDVNNSCQEVEFSFVANDTSGSLQDEFVVSVWNSANGSCSSPIAGSGDCPSNDPSCNPCSSALCDDICSAVVFDVPTAASNNGVLYSNTQDNTISDIINNQNSNVSSPSVCESNYALVIQEDLTVDQDWCMETLPENNRRVIILEAGKKIIVPFGSTLTLNDILIESCSDIFWNAFEVYGNIILNNCTIKDGRNAIIKYNSAEYTELRVEDCEFIDNYVSIVRVDEVGAQNANVGSSIYGSTFEGSGRMPQVYPGQAVTFDYPLAGIQCFNTQIDVGNTDREQANENIFKKMYNGILMNDGRLSVGTSRFYDIIKLKQNISFLNPDYAITGFGVHAIDENEESNYSILMIDGDGITPDLSSGVSFDNIPIGVCINNISNATVISSLFNNVEVGIEVSNCENNNVYFRLNNISTSKFGIKTNNNTPLEGAINDNDINLNSTAVNSSDFFVASAGILCSENFSRGNGWRIRRNNVNLINGDAGIVYRNGGNALISENNVTKGSGNSNKYEMVDIVSSFNSIVNCNEIDAGLPNEGVLSSTKGISIKDSYSMTVSCNTVASATQNVHFDGVCTDADFRVNTLSNGLFGLFLTPSAIMSPQSNKGNCFDDNSEAEAHHGSSVPFNVSASRFTVICGSEQGENDCICPPLDEIDTGTGDPLHFFSQNAFGETPTCDIDFYFLNCSERFGPQRPQNTNDDIVNLKVANGQLVYSGDYPLLEGMLRFNLFEKLDEFGIENTSQEYFDFYHTNLNDNLGLLNRSLTILSSENTHSDLKNILFNSKMELSDLTAQYMKDLLSIEEYSENAHNILEEINYTNAELSAFLIEDRANLDHMIETQLSVLESINPTNLYEQNMKWIISKVLQSNHSGFVEFTIEENESIRNLALECSEKAGHAVYLARSLYHEQIGWFDFDNLEDCTAIEARSKFDVETSIVNRVYPNPATNVVNVICNDNVVSSSFKLHDTQGRLVLNEKIIPGKNTFDISELTDAIYYFTVDWGKEDMEKGKLVIVKNR